jgi:hypothetical protein
VNKLHCNFFPKLKRDLIGQIKVTSIFKLTHKKLDIIKKHN